MNYKKYMGATLVAILIVSTASGVFMADAALAAGGSGVTRAVTATDAGQYEVTISINDTMPSVVGVKETLPEGSAFVSCTLPQGQYEVSGSDARFVAVNTTTFKYVVKGLEGKEITGQWTDMLGTGQGVVNVKGAAGADPGSTGGTSMNTQPTPGFITIVSLISICIVALLAWKRRDGN